MQATQAGRAGGLSDDAVAYAGLATATVCWAAAFIAGKIALAEMTPLTMAAWRYVLAALLIVPFAIRVWPTPATFRPLLLPLGMLVLLGGIAYPWLFLSALERTTATNASLLIALNPIGTVLFAPLVGEKLTSRRLLGTAIALFGAAIVITHGDLLRLGEISTHAGDLLALAAAVAWASFNLVSRGVVTRLPATAINATIFVLGGIGLFALAAPEQPVAQLRAASPAALGAILVSAALSSVLAGHLFLHSVQQIGISRAVVFIYCVPPLTAALSWVWLAEPLVLAQAVGGAAVLAGVALASRAPSEKADG